MRSNNLVELEKLLPEMKAVEDLIKEESNKKDKFEMITRETVKKMAPFLAACLIEVAAIYSFGPEAILNFMADAEGDGVGGAIIAILGIAPWLVSASVLADATNFEKEPLSNLSNSLVRTKNLLSKLQDLGELKNINQSSSIHNFLTETASLRNALIAESDRLKQLNEAESNRLKLLKDDLQKLNLFHHRSNSQNSSSNLNNEKSVNSIAYR